MRAIQSQQKLAWQRRQWLWAVLLGSLAGWSGISATHADEAKQPDTVQLVIDYGDGVQKHFTALPHSDKMTVLDALELGRKHSRGITFDHRGSKDTAFVTAIDGLTNEGQGKNWTFRVNGELAQSSCGIVPLSRGDVVLWKFGKAKVD